MNRIQLKLKYNFLQEIRLAHAVMESGYILMVKPSDADKFKMIRSFFKANYEFLNEENSASLISDIMIDHKSISPETRIGFISRPLILPHAMLKYCKSLWPEERKITYAFIGLVTPSREVWLNQILSRYISNYKKITGKLKLDSELYNLLYGLKKNATKILITASTKGRYFPGKSWDDDYFIMQAKARFILCPSGDVGCPWTYRFFEAMLCGAIPIVESVSPCYENFKFYTMNDDPRDIVYSKEIAEYNYQQCVKYLSVPIHELDAELARLAEPQDKSQSETKDKQIL